MLRINCRNDVVLETKGGASRTKDKVVFLVLTKSLENFLFLASNYY